MIVSGGHILAIDEVEHDLSLSGDGVGLPLGVRGDYVDQIESVSSKLDVVEFQEWSAQTEHWDVEEYSGAEGIEVSGHVIRADAAPIVGSGSVVILPGEDGSVVVSGEEVDLSGYATEEWVRESYTPKLEPDEDSVLLVGSANGDYDWVKIRSSKFGSSLADASGDLVWSEDSAASYLSENTVELWSEFSGIGFGAERAYADVDGNPFLDTYATIESVSSGLAQKQDELHFGYDASGEIVSINSSAIAQTEQEQSDWTEEDSSVPSYIKNKPDTSELVEGYGIALTYEQGSLIVSTSGMADSGYVDRAVSGKMDKSSSADFYPMAANPSGYLVAQDLNDYATESDLDYVSGAVDDLSDDLDEVSASIHDSKLKLQLGSGTATDTGFTANAASDVTLTIPEMTGTTSSANGTAGLVPAPAAGDENKVLKGDGTWGEASSKVRIIYDPQTEELHMDFSPPKIVNIGGRDYPYVQIGNQLWITENLDFISAGVNFNPENLLDGNPNCAYYNKASVEPFEHAGLLYNFAAAKVVDTYIQAKNPGWRVGTYSDYMTLLNYVGVHNNPGTKLRSKDFNGTDDFGFALAGAGYWDGSGNFNSLNSRCELWSTTEIDSTTSYGFESEVYDTYFTARQIRSRSGYSIRLVKDVT